MQAQGSGKRHLYVASSRRPDGRMATLCGHILQPVQGEACKRCTALAALYVYRDEVYIEAAELQRKRAAEAEFRFKREQAEPFEPRAEE